MAVRKCPKCGSVWYTALVNCAFCGVEGEEVKGPISPAKLNLVHGGVAAAPPPATKPPEPAPAEVPAPPPAEIAAPPPPPAPEPVKAEAPPPPPPPPKPEPLPEPPPRVERKAPPRLAPAVEPTTPAPLIPSATAPLVFGVLGFAACALLPLIGAFRNDRVPVSLALLGWALLAPFAPSAWLAAQRYEDRCRALGFSPAPAAGTGKLLGKLSSFLLVLELSALAVFVAVQALSGKISCPLWK